MSGNELGATLWRQRLLVVLVWLITAAAVALGLAVTPKTYEASATVQFRAVTTTGRQTVDPRSAVADAVALARSSTVLDEAVTGLPHPPPAARLAGEVSARAVGGDSGDSGDSVRVSVRDGDADTAALLANRIATTLTRFLPGQVSSTVSSSAVASGHFVSPDLTFVTTVGVALALVLGVLAALLRDRRTSTVLTAAGLEQALSGPVLAHLRPLDDERLPALRPGTPGAEVFERLAEWVPAAVGESPRPLMVAGMAAGDLNAYVAANLAVCWARGGRATLLIDARVETGRAVDGRGAAAHEPDAPGLTGIWAGADLEEAVTPGPVELFDVLPAGRARGPAPDGAAWSRLLEQAERSYEIVVVIAPRWRPGHDDAPALPLADLVVPVATGWASATQVDRRAAELRRAGHRVVGGILLDKQGESGLGMTRRRRLAVSR